MESFEDLGLRPELVDAVGHHPVPTAVQSGAIPVLRRGGNALLEASAGSGVTAAFALPLLDRLAESAEAGSPRALVLVPTADEARGVAASIGRLGRAVDLRATVPGSAWSETGDIVVTTPRRALSDISESKLKLGAIEAVVVHGLDALLGLDGADPLEEVMASLPSGAQRVVTAASAGDDIADFVERHARRALRVPSRSLEDQDAGTSGRLIAVVALPERKLDALAGLLAKDGAERVVCRTSERARAVAAELALRGLDRDVVVSDSADDTGAAALISYDVPADAATLAERHAEGGAVLVTPRELPHLRTLAARIRYDLTTREPERAEGDDVARFHDRLRDAIRREDLSPYHLLLEPLTEEFSLAEIAAAAAWLARARVRSEQPVPAEPAAGQAPPPSASSYARLFLSAGQRDSVGPGDILGAITGETGIKGEAVGKIEVRDTFSTVEIAAGMAQSVIDALNGKTLRGRSLRVDYDRGGGGRAPRRPRPRS